MRMTRIVSVALLALALSACGFQLRGTDTKLSNLPTTFVDGPISDALTRKVGRELQASGVQLQSSAADAGALLKIVQSSFDRRILSVGPDDRAREYEIVLVAEFVLLDRAGTPLVNRQTISLVRDYFNDETQVLGRANEESFLRENLEDEMAKAIVRRIKARLGS